MTIVEGFQSVRTQTEEKTQSRLAQDWTCFFLVSLTFH